MSTPRALAAVLRPIARKALGRRHAALGALLDDWPHVVGPDLAERALPHRLDFPRGRRDGGVLHLRVEPADALELQHETPRILERINGHYGYRAVERLKLVQVPRPHRRPARRSALTPTDAAGLDEAVSGVDDAELRRRLARLGEAVFRRRTGR